MSDLNLQEYNLIAPILDQLISHYRALLAVVRKEKEILISADLDKLNENNKTKEEFLLKIKTLEKKRESTVNEIVEKINFQQEHVSLLMLANYFSFQLGDKIRNYHSVLTLLLKRVQELNLENEILIHSALENITGAMSSIKETLEDRRKIYENKGKYSEQGSSGKLVSREA